MLDLADKRIRLGLEYPDSLEWRNWTPGREYHRILYVKNNVHRAQVVQWCPPASSHFWTSYQEPVRLNGFVSAAIGVVFKPAKLQLYESAIDFSTAKGSFYVALRGIPPRVHLSIPKSLNLGYCPVNDSVERKFIMRNLGDTILTPSWEVDLPFIISPAKPTLNPGDSITAVGKFSPSKAGAYEAVALCLVGGNSSLKLKLEGVGKHSFLILSQSVMNFGSLLLGTARVIYLRVTNKSAVPSYYRLKRPDTSLEESISDFTIEPTEGTIPDGSTVYLKVTYRPTIAGTSPLEHFDLVVPQTSPVSFTCVGGVVRPSVRISLFSVTFGSVTSGDYSSRSITLKNRTDLAVMFQFMPRDLGVFELVESNGYIGPRSTVMVTVRFKPIEPLNYYVRVMCIIKDQYPLYCDLVGTCYREMVKASTLMCCHVDRHRQVISSRSEVVKAGSAPPHVDHWSLEKVPSDDDSCFAIHGLEPQNPTTEDAENCNQSTMSEHGTAILSSSEFFKGLVVPTGNRQKSFRDSFNSFMPDYPPDQSKKAPRADEVWSEYFHGRIVGWDPVTLDVSHIDFGGCACMESADARSITVKNNHSDAHVICVWVVREPSLETIKPTGAFVDSDFSETMYLKNFDPVFQVSPPMAQIAAGDAFSFSVSYRPKQENLYYFKHLACFVYVINSFQNDSYTVPPWSTTVTAFGHSFPSDAWEVRPEASFYPRRVVFPPALKGTCVYQTVELRNHRHTSLRFKFQQEDLSPQFAVTPTEGVIPGNSFQLVSFRFEAGEPDTYTSHISCKLNHSLTHELTISMVATSHTPQITISNGSSISFKPTNVGTQENLPIVVTNLSGIHVQYEFFVPFEYSDVLAISPISGVLRGKENQVVICTFSPAQQKHYSFQVPCSYSACTEAAYYQDHKVLIRSCPSTSMDYLSLDMDGEGLVGVITVTPQRADFGMLVVGNQYEHRLSLFNSTKGILDYSLSCSSMTVAAEKYSLTFDHPTGTIPARSYQDIMVLFNLKQNINYKLELSCKTLAPVCDENITKQKSIGAHTTCAVSAVAAYPSLAISGIRSERLSAAQLWDRFRIDDLNVLLAEPPKAATTQSAYKYLFCLGKPLDEFQPFEFRFMAQNVGRKPSVVHLVFQCRVPLPVKWRIRLWNDTEVDMESWVEEGEPSEEEKRLVAIWKMKLFEVEPRRGYLKPGEEVHVRFSYHHKVEGFHEFPAILEIEKGCVVQLELSGKTVPFSQKILGLQNESYTLAPMVVGDLNPPVQTFELRNDGYLELSYELDTGSLKQIEQENHGFKVIQCLNPRGWIAPSESILLSWLFQPLEARIYGTKLTIYVEGGKKNELTIQGMGFSSTNRGSLRYTQQKSRYGKAYAWYGLPGRLSTEFLDFGRVTELSLNQKLVSVRNTSDEYDISFSWRQSMAAEYMIYGRFEVVPQSGTIEPLKECLCKVKFRAGIQPQDFLTTLYCDISVVKVEPTPRSSPPTPPPPEEVIDKDGTRLGVGIYNKRFKHIPVVNQLPEGMKGKLPHFTPMPLMPLPPPPKIIVPPDQVLYLTVTSHILTAEKFHSTTERVVNAFISFPEEDEGRLDESAKETQSELVSLVLMELLQECLHEEAKDKDSTCFKAFDDRRVMCFEEFQRATGKYSEELGSSCCGSDQEDFEEAFLVRKSEMTELVLESMLFGLVKELCEERE